MSFRALFAAVFIGTALVVSAFLVNAKRPERETTHHTAALVRSTGKCAECHRNETGAIVHQYERSGHARQGITCLQCHQPAEGQDHIDHRGFTIAARLTAKNCASCHTTEYEQYARSRHALPAHAAVLGTRGLSPEMVAQGEKHHPGMVDRPANALAKLEGAGALASGCMKCHSIGSPNADGSIGTCTACHARHAASVELARTPETCGQCHMGPDHSQLEIYSESKHGVLFHAQKATFRLDAAPKHLTTKDMPLPTCATCHMSGIDGLKVTHDTTERLSWFLYAAVSKKRQHYARGQTEMKETCLKCHSKGPIDRWYEEAEVVVEATNQKVKRIMELEKGLREAGLLTPQPFDEPIEFLFFDYWHYYGRTAKHGAFMGGADFVQWHGNYELLKVGTEIEHIAAQIRKSHGK